jgi:hypothetical protein
MRNSLRGPPPGKTRKVKSVRRSGAAAQKYGAPASLLPHVNSSDACLRSAYAVAIARQRSCHLPVRHRADTARARPHGTRQEARRHSAINGPAHMRDRGRILTMVTVAPFATAPCAAWQASLLHVPQALTRNRLYASNQYTSDPGRSRRYQCGSNRPERVLPSRMGQKLLRGSGTTGPAEKTTNGRNRSDIGRSHAARLSGN